MPVGPTGVPPFVLQPPLPPSEASVSGLVIGDIGRDFGQRIGNRFRVSGGIVLDRIGHGLDRFHLTGFVDDAQADPLAITYIPIYDVRAVPAAGRYDKSRIPECDNL